MTPDDLCINSSLDLRGIDDFGGTELKVPVVQDVLEPDARAKRRPWIPPHAHVEPDITWHHGPGQIAHEICRCVEFEVPGQVEKGAKLELMLSLIHISEPTRLLSISYAVFCL